MKEIAVEMWSQKFNIPNFRNVGFLNQLGKRNKVYLQEMMQKVVEFKAENTTLDTPSLPKTPANIHQLLVNSSS